MTKRRLGASYHKLFISTVISNVGDGMSIIAYPWLASAITRNPILISRSCSCNDCHGLSSPCRQV